MKFTRLARFACCFLAGTLLAGTIALSRSTPINATPQSAIQQYTEFQSVVAAEAQQGDRLHKLTPEDAQMVALRAFLRGAILAAEIEHATKTVANPYKVLFGYGTFDSYDRHPDICVPFADTCSTAAGAYQFLSSTWNGLKQDYPDIWDTTVEEFAPQNQDRGAIALLVRRGSYFPLLDGVTVLHQRVQVDRAAFNRAVFNACAEWASFPCAPGEGYGDSNGFYDRPAYGNQNARSLDWMWERFQRALAEEQRVLGSTSTIATPSPANSSYTLPSAYQGIAREGDIIADWVVTSDFGWRSINVAGASSFHRGVDLASPDPSSPTKGRGMKAIGFPDTWVEVRCWWDDNGGGRVATLIPESLQSAGQPRLSFDYLHLESCIVPDGQKTRVKAGAIVATVGDTGVGAAHAHIGQRVGRELINPQVGFIEWAFTGVAPQAIAPPPADPWGDKVLSYFLEVAMGAEFGESGSMIRKWQGEVAIEVHGRPTRADRRSLERTIADINQLTRGQIVLKEVRSGGRLKIHFLPTSEFSKIEPNYEPPNQGYFWAHWGQNGVINSANVLIDSTNGVTQDERAHLIREELTQALGLMGDSWKYQESVFYQGWTATQEYGWIDKALIMALYDPAIAPGMRLNEVVRVMVGTEK